MIFHRSRAIRAAAHSRYREWLGAHQARLKLSIVERSTGFPIAVGPTKVWQIAAWEMRKCHASFRLVEPLANGGLQVALLM